jgi:hypothetical protein
LFKGTPRAVPDKYFAKKQHVLAYKLVTIPPT